VTASDTLFDSRCGFRGQDIADFEVLRVVAMTTIFSFLYMGAHWRHLANATEASLCGGDAMWLYVKLL